MEELEKLKKALENLENKQNKILFLTADSDGARASIAYNYELVKILKENDYNAMILHEKKEYKGVASWLGEEYASLPHLNIEDGSLQVGANDVVIIPEIFGHVLEQMNAMPCQKIMSCQSYDHILDTLPPGFGWSNYGVTRCITTTESQKNYIMELFHNITVDIINYPLSDKFSKPTYLKKPIIAIHTRDTRDTSKIIKAFYLKNPQFRWITFKDLRNLSVDEFADSLKEACVSVWVDREGGFGTFPLESMKSGTPVIGLVPNLRPDWLTEHNGIWTVEETKLTQMVGAFIKNWLEDSIPIELYTHTDTSHIPYTLENTTKSLLGFFEGYFNEMKSQYEDSINKFSPHTINA